MTSGYILDGEICCLEPDGRTKFRNLLFRRERPYFYAFDLLMLNGRDLRGLPLTEGKRRLADRHELFEVWESRRPRFHRATLALV